MEDDPTTGLVNLLDLWMVFAVALLLALIEVGVVRQESARWTNAGTGDADTIPKESLPIRGLHATSDLRTGEGERLGTAYRLSSGEVVYVPDPQVPTVKSPSNP